MSDNTFAKSVIWYGWLICGSEATTNLQNIECAETNIEVIFFKKKIDSMVNVLADHKFSTFLNFSWWN